ncbi:mannose-1-phosphate guanylyltransferase/mannose-6-phosphate isomerase [Indioceanicola profundi]|uniref:mannose-1-phosphate guanylyltransferase/mannose-6-phosphate isomerase n=1 Tax=Indioceanicola profundi TaxID=2220096 RepID=UPI000E6AA14C|nr:mannose-1-phosphate guanylyltransferase/mannose-6-phosphate isomerase [Indioceanicola profundi]
MTGSVTPVILSGGVGSRLWPLSRERLPKQLLALNGRRTMVQETALRLQDTALFAAPLVVCNQEHRFAIAEQMYGVGVAPAHLVLEPFGRNTAPAAAVAAELALAENPDALILLLPADHVVLNPKAFGEAVRRAVPAARGGRLVTFGITPTAPETGYGYIEAGAPLDGAPGVSAVASFTEKPKADVAEAYVKGGRHLWNSGMFLFPAQLYLKELGRLAPDVLEIARASLAAAKRDLGFLRLDANAFQQAPNISIDYAVMEKTALAAVVACDIGWTDVGSWSALWEIGDKDQDGNVVQGDTLLVDTEDSYVRSEHGLAAVVGLKDVVVVATEDAVMVSHKDRAQDVKLVVDRLKSSGRTEHTEHKRVDRPWGFYQSVHTGERFQVKRLCVKPGQKLSLQKHFHRAEHWIVVNGTALVTIDDRQVLVTENESVYLPLGCVHRLENPGKVMLNLIEVQTGSYLGEDDIVRFEDTYGRT